MPRLPEELIVEILVKLPVKSLLRFRCVCKSWFDLIKSPDFINMHLKNHSTKNNGSSVIVIRSLEDRNKHFMSFHSYESLGIISPVFQVPYLEFDYVEVCEPCNGLLCLVHEKSIVLSNPSTREFKLIPPRPFPCPKTWDFRVKAIGLGFDSITKDYKVVAFVRLWPRGADDDGFYCVYKAEIYNVRTNSWSIIDHDIDIPDIVYSHVYGTVFNGAPHWIVISKGNLCILSFDISTEVFRYMELPDDHLVKCVNPLHLTVLNESLALFAHTDPGDDTSEQFQFVDVWVMHQYGVAQSWTKQVTIGPVFGIRIPFLLWKNEAILMESNEGLESSEGQLVSCALDTHEMNEFGIHGIMDTFGVMVYQESLVSIN